MVSRLCRIVLEMTGMGEEEALKGVQEVQEETVIQEVQEVAENVQGVQVKVQDEELCTCLYPQEEGEMKARICRKILDMVGMEENEAIGEHNKFSQEGVFQVFQEVQEETDVQEVQQVVQEVQEDVDKIRVENVMNMEQNFGINHDELSRTKPEVNSPTGKFLSNISTNEKITFNSLFSRISTPLKIKRKKTKRVLWTEGCRDIRNVLKPSLKRPPDDQEQEERSKYFKAS